MLAVLTVSAQKSVGSWSHIYSYGGVPSDIIDTGTKVYVASVSSLMSYDRENDEYDTLTRSNGLNDAHIQSMHYDRDSRKLLVVYANGNMDFILDDGTIINMPEIKDLTAAADKRLNNVSFRDSRMYMAWDFGMVIIDMNRYSVVESLLTNVALLTARPIGRFLMIGDWNQNIYTSPLDAPHYSLSQFNKVTPYRLESTSECDSMSIYARSWINVIKITLSDDGKSWTTDWNDATTGVNGDLHNLPDGRTFMTTDTDILIIDRNGNKTNIPIPADLKNSLFSTVAPESEMWVATPKGLASYSIDDQKNFTLTRQPYHPEGISSPSIGDIVQDDNAIYFSSKPVDDDYSIASYISKLSDGKFTQYIPDTIPHATNSYTRPANILHSCYFMLPDKHNPGHLLVANYFDGVLRFDPDGNIKGRYDNSNSTIAFQNNWCTNAEDLKYDSRGNLWVISGRWTSEPSIHVLPAAKCKLAETTPDDWHAIDAGAFKHEMNARLLITASDMVLAFSTDNMMAYDTKGTESFADDSQRLYTSFTDQDGLTLSPTGMRAMIEDHNGRVWVGHDMGVFEITSPRAMMSNTFNITRLKVPRNDGTNYADYLLDGLQVTCIAVDGANRKWIGTNNSGLYLVNENGTEILEHFTTLNSELPSDMICAVHCDRNSNRVYVGTDVGLSVYTSDAAPSHDDFSEVYAYPNPVRPDYTGWITVAGLMDNSLVKIADAAGNVFFTGRSEGGMITWNGCTPSGERVRTGVYFVMASSGPSATNSGIVAKILVVN